MSRSRRVLRNLLGIPVALAVGVLVLSGCGSSVTLTAAEQAPSLRVTLSKVDNALAAHQYVTARQTLAALITQTRKAQEDGSLSAEAATRIITAARALLAQVPKPVAATPTPTPTATPRPAPEPKKHEPKKKHGKPGKGH